MQFRKFWAVLVVAALLMSVLGGCAVGSQMAWPDRELAIDLDTALMAQDTGMAALMMGKVDWTESEFSSFLTYLLRQNTGEMFPVDTIQTWFEPDNKVYIRINLKDGVMLGGNSIDLVGAISVQDNHLSIALDEAGANGVSAGGLLLQPISDQINAVLAGPQFGVAVDVTTDTGMLSVGLAGM